MLLDAHTALSRGDLENSFFEIRELDENISDLSASQKFIHHYFMSKTKGERLASRSDLVPSELTRYLPSIALFDLVYDDDGNLIDVVSRLLGTAISNFYGEFTGLSVNSKVVKDAVPNLHIRLTAQIKAAIDCRNAVVTIASSPDKDRLGIRINTMVIPLSSNGKDIEKAFLYLEVDSNLYG